VTHRHIVKTRKNIFWYSSVYGTLANWTLDASSFWN